MKAAFLVGRALLGGFFVYNGIHHFQQTEFISGYVKSKGIPMPKAAVLGTGAALVVGGASLITGIKPKYGIAAIVGFLGTVSPTIHDFWNAQDPQQKMNDQINFTKNLALAGATLALAAVDEPWPVSVPLAQPGRMERARNVARLAAREANSFGRDAKKFSRDASKFGRETRKSAKKWWKAS